MKAPDFVDLVRQMRAAGKQYYKSRTQANLIAARELERKVDQALEEGIEIPEAAAKQLDLFALANTAKENTNGQQ